MRWIIISHLKRFNGGNTYLALADKLAIPAAGMEQIGWVATAPNHFGAMNIDIRDVCECLVHSASMMSHLNCMRRSDPPQPWHRTASIWLWVYILRLNFILLNYPVVSICIFILNKAIVIRLCHKSDEMTNIQYCCKELNHSHDIPQNVFLIVSHLFYDHSTSGQNEVTPKLSCYKNLRSIQLDHQA